MLRDHLPNDFLPPPSVQTHLIESDQGNFVGNSPALRGYPLFPFVSCLVFLGTRYQYFLVLSANLVFFFVTAVLSVDFFLILSVQVRLSATSLSEVALKVWQAPCTLSASVGPASPN